MIKIGLGIPTRSQEFFKETAISLAHLHTAITLEYGPPEIYDVCDRIERGRNKMVDNLLASDCTHLLMIDSDQKFPAHTAKTLIEADKDIIAVNVAKKIDGAPVIERNLAGEPLDYINKEIEETEFLGTGIIMIKREVFETIPWPWFHAPALHEWRVIIAEDLAFSRIARKTYGYKLYCHTRLSWEIGHIGYTGKTLLPLIEEQMKNTIP